MLKMQRTAAMGIKSWVVSGRIWKHVRMIEKWPSFISTPACSMLVAAGAAAWPTGDQECSGQRGAIEANPKKHKSQMIVASVPSKWAFSARTGISKVLRPEEIGRASCRERG